MIDQLISLHPLLFHSIIFLASLIVLAKSSDMVVYGISNYAKKLGISDYLIGFIVISIGTALPELLAALNGALVNQGELAFGVVMGSNLFKIPLLGILLVIAVSVKNKIDFTGSSPMTTFIITIAPLLLVIDGLLSRIDGIVLLILFFLYIVKLWQSEGTLGKIKEKVAFKSIYKEAIISVIALTALLLSARWLVFSSIQLSKMLNIPSYIVGLLVIGIGASAPELMVQLRSIRSKHQNMAIGNVLGSLIANSAFVFGIVALIKPISIGFSTLVVTLIFMSIGTIILLKTMMHKELSWKDGLLFILVYALFLLAEFVF